MEINGINVREQRRHLGLTQTELAQRCGISRTYLSMLERGEADNPSMAVVKALEAALGISTFDKPERMFTASCYLCGTMTGLQMIPHRKDHQIVGWIFACRHCAPKLYNSELIALLPKQPPDHSDLNCSCSLEAKENHGPAQP